MPLVKRIFPALTLMFLLALLASAAAPAEGANRLREVGGYPDSPFPKAGCPADCQAIGRVTGYQVQIGSAKNPYLMHRPGKVVAFTIRLGKPDEEQTRFFTNLFGGAPQARLTILKKPKRDRPKTNDLRVVAQSELVDLGDYMGSSPTFALSKPLVVPDESIIALTVPTWAPAFTINLGSDQAWRSARDPDDCGGTSQVAQQTVNRTRGYDCFYRTARLLYSATFIPDPKKTSSSSNGAERR